MDKHYFIIRTLDNEYGSSDKRICSSFKEAKSHIMEYADWFSDYGSCTIKEVDENFYIYQKWVYRNGKLLEHENFIKEVK